VKRTFVIARRELRAHLSSPWAYVVTAAFVAVTGYGFAWSPITEWQTSIQGFLGWASFFLLFLAPALSMRLLAAEQELGTMEMLLTAPVKDREIVMGKYLASLVILGLMLGLTLYFPLLLFWFGDPDPGPVFTGYLGLGLLGAVFLAVGLFASSLTANQVVAFVVGSAILVILWYTGQAGNVVGGMAGEVLRYLSLSGSFPELGRGILDFRPIAYDLTLIVLFLFLTVRSLESRRWR